MCGITLTFSLTTIIMHCKRQKNNKKKKYRRKVSSCYISFAKRYTLLMMNSEVNVLNVCTNHAVPGQCSAFSIFHFEYHFNHNYFNSS